jgi:hypothetical protein
MNKINFKLNFLPKNANFHCNVKIGNFSKNFSNHRSASLYLIDELLNLNPKNITIPTFTYSFVKTRKFSLNSQSETGRFSEEIRKNLSLKNRSVDPMFSIVSVLKKFEKTAYIESSFDERSVYKNFDIEDAIIINFDLNHFISDSFHYFEKLSNVAYRKTIALKGKIVLDNDEKNIIYKFFCRRNINLDWDRKKIVLDLINHDLLNYNYIDNYPIIWFEYIKVKKFILEKIKYNHEYLLQ